MCVLCVCNVCEYRWVTATCRWCHIFLSHTYTHIYFSLSCSLVHTIMCNSLLHILNKHILFIHTLASCTQSLSISELVEPIYWISHIHSTHILLRQTHSYNPSFGENNQSSDKCTFEWHFELNKNVFDCFGWPYQRSKIHRSACYTQKSVIISNGNISDQIYKK